VTQDNISLFRSFVARVVFIPQKQRFNLGMLSECPGPSEVLEESYLRTYATLGIKKHLVLYRCHFSRRKLGGRGWGKPGVNAVKQMKGKSLDIISERLCSDEDKPFRNGYSYRQYSIVRIAPSQTIRSDARHHRSCLNIQMRRQARKSPWLGMSQPGQPPRLPSSVNQKSLSTLSSAP